MAQLKFGDCGLARLNLSTGATPVEKIGNALVFAGATIPALWIIVTFVWGAAKWLWAH